ncbi:MAG: metallophosphoesterase [Polyangiaceae bacterium]
MPSRRDLLLRALGSALLTACVAASASCSSSEPASDTQTDDVTASVIHFAAIGDTGSGSNDQRRVAAALADVCEGYGCDFVLLLGDNFYENGVASASDPLFESRFERMYARVDAPFYVVLGNHDYGGDGWGREAARARAQVAYSERSSRWKMEREYYKLTYKHASLFAMDTTMQLFGDAQRQEEEMGAWVRASRATWKIAFGHHPYLSNGDHGNAGSYDGEADPLYAGAGVKGFFDRVMCGNVDLYLSGHDHSLQWMERTCNGTELAVSGAGGRVGDLPGRNATRFAAAELGFMYVTIRGKKLVAEVIDADRRVLYTRTITKP